MQDVNIKHKKEQNAKNAKNAEKVKEVKKVQGTNVWVKNPSYIPANPPFLHGV